MHTWDTRSMRIEMVKEGYIEEGLQLSSARILWLYNQFIQSQKIKFLTEARTVQAKLKPKRATDDSRN